MAYETKYQLPFASPEITGDIYLQKDGWAGGITILRLRENGIEVQTEFKGWFEPILHQKVILQIINDGADFYDYLDLFELEEKDFKIVIEIQNESQSITLFEGYIDCTPVQQKYQNNSTIILVGTNYISKLEYHFDSELEVLEAKSVIDIIRNALKGTDKIDPIRCNINLMPTGHFSDVSDIFSAFNRSAIWTEFFWDNNIERMNSLEILEAVLKTFDCYLYWWDGYWRIERYRDMYAASTYFYSYTIDHSSAYGYDSGVARHERINEIVDIWDLIWLEESQLLNMIPGYNKIEIFEVQKLFLNLIKSDLTGATTQFTQPIPNRREWICENIEFYDAPVQVTSYYDFGLATPYISNSVTRNFSYAGTSIADTDKSKTEYWKGLTTKFTFTNDGISTTLNFQWTNVLPAYLFTMEGTVVPIDEQTIYSHYWIRIEGGTHNGKYLSWDDEENEWVIFSGDQESSCNYIIYSAEPLLNINDDTVKVRSNTTVPIWEIAGLDAGDYTLVFGMGLVLFQDFGGLWNWPVRLNDPETMGDVLVVASGQPQDNLITGTLANNVLESKRIGIDLFDIENLNYKNGFLTGEDYDERTETWAESEESTEDYTLAEWLLISKFQLYNKNRKKIKGRIKSNRILRPFELFYDSKGGTSASPTKYILIPEAYFPITGEYRVALYEYDNTEEINFI